ncbi:hypothetical protein [Aquibacillus sediminis]|uniref:hypothetical protein n=1 Tax=Aquibacillus sediminis TaxID=2574734 RepID=UPI0011095212|nr:hypothetical protein [Aquibacillus sediminis]
MRNHFAIHKPLTQQKGFILPYILFVAALVLIMTTSSISIYYYHHEQTHYLEEQLKMDTLLQMAQQEFKATIEIEQDNDIKPGQITYRYPYGNVLIYYRPVTEQMIKAEFHVLTDNQSKYATITTIQQ